MGYFSNYLQIAPYWNWNRLELIKLCTNANLQIAPYWNWNKGGLWFLQGLQLLSKSHHTGIETAQLIHKPSTVRQLQIAPYWNWNFSIISGVFLIFDLQIAPYWNWNELGRLVLTFTAFTPNRTILELKQHLHRCLGCLVSNSKSHHTGIETAARLRAGALAISLQIAPYWNWNGTYQY